MLLGLLQCVTFVDKILKTETSFTGFQIMFGYVEEIKAGNTVITSIEHLKFSFMALLAFGLPLIGGVLLLTKNKLINLIATICYVAGAVMLFILPTFVVTEIYIADLFTSSLAVGAILSAICSILGGLVALNVTFTK